MRAAAVQFKADKDDVAGSRARLTALTADAVVDSDLVVLPEMAVSGYIFPDRDAVAAVAEDPRGPTFQALSPLARGARSWVVCGFAERAGDRLFNSAMVIDGAGALAFVYRKTLLFDADLHWAAPGDSGYRRFATPFGSFGVGICMDLNDPRFLLWVWRKRPDALAFPTNWVEEGADVWPYWIQRVGGSGAVLVAANTYGEDGGVPFSGRSAIVAGDRVLAGAPAHGDHVLRARWP
ncbi:MAG: carbon-nitrogen hydrolase family protein [Alphaproteobacteria bacterium]|nr:carbon-nitrogen hydrolase family protein [Alphaproteobacteria bacterium]